MMTVNIVTGSMLKGLREAGCRITTICKCKGYCSLGREYFPRPLASGNSPTLGTIYTDIPIGRVM